MGHVPNPEVERLHRKSEHVLTWGIYLRDSGQQFLPPQLWKPTLTLAASILIKNHQIRYSLRSRNSKHQPTIFGLTVWPSLNIFKDHSTAQHQVARTFASCNKKLGNIPVTLSWIHHPMGICPLRIHRCRQRGFFFADVINKILCIYIYDNVNEIVNIW